MKKINFKIRSIKAILIEYIMCLLILEFLLIIINVCGGFKYIGNVQKLEVYETMNIETIASDNNYSNGNFKITVLDHDELAYYIKVDYKKQVVTVYVKGQNDDKYLIPIRTMICSTGIDTPTEGVYEISDKYQWGYLVGGVYGQYCSRITGPILFHSVPYMSQNKSSLEYWEYDKLGQPVSKGCIRLKVEDAKWIYDYCKKGTKVEFVADELKGIKEKDDFKLSDYEDSLKGWDPTDPDPNNPWRDQKVQNKGENN